MADMVRELYEKAEEYSDKYKDQELYDYMLSLANKLEQYQILRHQFGYFLMHAKAVLPYDVRPRHFQEALERAERFLKQDD